MNHIKKLLLFIVLPLSIVAFINTPAGDEIVKSIRAGDAAGVAKYFDSSVEVTILSTSNTYSKSQAEQVLKEFFAKNKVSGFKLLHNVDSRGGDSESIIGTLSAGGNTYRVYVLLNRASGNKNIIQEINIRER